MSVIYRNRAMLRGLGVGQKENPIPLNAARAGKNNSPAIE